MKRPVCLVPPYSLYPIKSIVLILQSNIPQSFAIIIIIQSAQFMILSIYGLKVIFGFAMLPDLLTGLEDVRLSQSNSSVIGKISNWNFKITIDHVNRS